MPDKTHYRKAFDSPYLSSADIVEPTDLTIMRVVLEPDKTKKSKELFNTAYFEQKEIRPGETLKPMILNAGNSRIMKDMTGSHFIEDWLNVRVQIYVDPNVQHMNSIVEGLRINPVAPPELTELVASDITKWMRAIERCRKDGNLDAVKTHMIISPENEQLIKEQAKVGASQH